MTQNMRAVLIKNGKGGADALYLGETPKPAATPGTVLVKVKAFGLNRMDILQREGKYPGAPSCSVRREGGLNTSTVPPHASQVLGVEFSGVVEEVGSEPGDDDPNASLLREALKKWKSGDEVYGLGYGGAYAEYIAVYATHLMQRPSHLSFVQAASIPEVWLTGGSYFFRTMNDANDLDAAYQALVLISHVKQDENVLIHAAASGVGVAAIQLARLFGAKTVTATASTQEKLDFVTKTIPLGATLGVNYKTQDFAAEVKTHTEGHGADVVVDFVGQSHWAKNIDALALDGRMVHLAFLSGAVVENMDLGPLLRKRLSINGTTLRARSVAYQADLIARFGKDVSEKLTGSEGEGEVRTWIHKVYKWGQIREAHEEMERDANSGKIIIEVE
jgi:NADPH:quinone reductase-like Zn-dependent oxidoreductase